MPGKDHGCYGEMQQDVKLPKDMGSQNGAKKGENPFFGVTCLHELPPNDQYLNPVELFVCSLQRNVVGACLLVKWLPVPGAGGCEGAAPLIAEPHAKAIYTSTNHQHLPCQSV